MSWLSIKKGERDWGGGGEIFGLPLSFFIFFFCSFLSFLPFSSIVSIHKLPLSCIFSFSQYFCLENHFSRLPNMMFTIFLKISLNLWVFEHLWKTHLWNPFSTFFYLPWHFLLSHLGSSHFMGNMNPQLSGMMRRDFSKTHLSMLQTLPPKTSRWVHFLFSLVNLLILAWYLRNLWWFFHLGIRI